MSEELTLPGDIPASYTIRRHPRGLVVVGHVPIREVSDLMAFARGFEFDIVDGLLCEHLGATFVITSSEHSEAWRRELGVEVPHG